MLRSTQVRFITAFVGGFGSWVPLAHAQTDNTKLGSLALQSNTTGSYNTALGASALTSNTTGSGNTATGRSALQNNGIGTSNTATGRNALYANSNGAENTAIGDYALRFNVSGNWNTAVGKSALYHCTDDENSALGYYALRNLTSGIENTAVGYQAGDNMLQGDENTAVGAQSLGGTDGGYANTALGSHAMSDRVSGDFNTAVGTDSLLSVDGANNTAVGYSALSATTQAHGNTGVGSDSLTFNSSGAFNTAVGGRSLYFNNTGAFNTAVGVSSGPTATGLSNTGAFGYLAVPTASNTIRIGNDSITAIGGIVAWSNLSDARLKQNVRTNVPGLDLIRRLRPVTFEWNRSKLGVAGDSQTLAAEERSSSAAKRHTGFLAQEVESAARECGFAFSAVVPPANDRSHYELRYAEFVVPLVKAVQEQQAEIEELRRAMASSPANTGHSGPMSGAAASFGAVGLLGLGMLLGKLRERRGPSPTLTQV